VALLPPVVWAWRLVFAEPTRFNRIAFASWVVGTLSASIALATLPVTSGWALPTGLGGVSGDLLLRLPSSLAEPVGIAAVVIFLVFAALAVASVLHACGLAFRQYLDVRPKVRRSPPPAAAMATTPPTITTMSHTAGDPPPSSSPLPVVGNADPAPAPPSGVTVAAIASASTGVADAAAPAAGVAVGAPGTGVLVGPGAGVFVACAGCGVLVGGTGVFVGGAPAATTIVPFIRFRSALL